MYNGLMERYMKKMDRWKTVSIASGDDTGHCSCIQPINVSDADGDATRLSDKGNGQDCS